MAIDITHIPHLRVRTITGNATSDTVFGDPACLADECGADLPDSLGRVACPECGTLHEVTVDGSFTQITIKK